MSNMEVAQHVEVIKSAEPAVRSISRFRELPFWKRGITIATIGLSAIATSCSGNTTGNETTITPPTTITTEVPTTTLPPTTTEVPTTTTSTAVPETTPTTEAIDLSIPTGEMTQRVEVSPGQFQVKDLAPGVIYYEEDSTDGYLNWSHFAATILDVYIDTYENFQGTNIEDMVYINVYITDDTNGNSFTKSLPLGRKSDLIDQIRYITSSNVSDSYGRDQITIEDLIPDLESRAKNKSQIGIGIISNYNQSIVNICNDESQYSQMRNGVARCEILRENFENFENNTLLLNILNSDVKSAEAIMALSNSNIFVDSISIFPFKPRG